MLWRQKKKSVELIISMLSHGIIDHYHFPADLVKDDRDKWPNLIFKKSRVTVQGEGKIFVLLKNKSSDIISIPENAVLGESRSLITADCIATKLGRTIKGESQKPATAQRELEVTKTDRKPLGFVYFDSETLDDGNFKQFTQIGCFSASGSANQFFAKISPERLLEYKSLKEDGKSISISLLSPYKQEMSSKEFKCGKKIKHNECIL